MLQVTISVDDASQMHVQSNVTNRDILLDVLLEATRAVRADMQRAAKEAAPRIVTAPEGALRALPKVNGG